MSNPPTIVIADADEEVRLAVAEAVALAAPQAKLVEIADGAGLKRLLKSQPVDLLFIDTILPSTDGFDLLEWRQQAGAESMVVIMSDLLAPQWPSTAQRVSAYDVLLKPMSNVQVSRIVEAQRTLSRRLNLLVVDPSRETQTLIRRLLRESQFRFDISEAVGGRQAVALAKEAPVDLALVANELPDFPALEVACRINGKHPEARIVLTGRSVEEGVVRQFSTFGISGFLAKPFGFAEIDKILHEAFGLWRPYLLAVLHEEQRRLLDSVQTQPAVTTSAAR